MSSGWRDERLPCGAGLGGIVEQVADGRAPQRSAHQQSCQYCQTALAEVDRAWEPVRDLAAAEVEVPPGLVASIMRKVRRLAQVGWVTLSRTARGVTTASAWVLAAIAEAAADTTPEVHRVGTSFGRLVDTLRQVTPGGKGERTAVGGAAYEVADYTAGVDIDVVTVYGVPVPDVADAIRRNVISDVRSLTGVEVDEVNVRVTDIALDDED